jgi:hypothetical protein
VNPSIRRKRRRQTQLPLIETSEPQQDDDDDYVDEGDLSGPAPPPDSAVNASIRRRSSRHVILTSSTGTPIHPPYATAVEASTRRKSRRQTELLSIETSEALLDDADYVDGDRDLSGSSWEHRLSELADYRKIHGHCNVPRIATYYTLAEFKSMWTMAAEVIGNSIEEIEQGSLVRSGNSKVEVRGITDTCVWKRYIACLIESVWIGYCTVHSLTTVALRFMHSFRLDR